MKYNKPTKKDMRNNLREYGLDLFLAGLGGGPEGKLRKKGGRFVSNHITPSVEPKFNLSDETAKRSVLVFLDQWGIPVPDPVKEACLSQEDQSLPAKIVAYIGRKTQKTNFATSEGVNGQLPDEEADNEFPAGTVMLSPEDLSSYFSPFVESCLPMIEFLYSHKGTLNSVTIEKAVSYNDAVASFEQDRQMAFINLGVFESPIAAIRDLAKTYYGIPERPFEKMPVIFYHMYAFRQAQVKQGLDVSQQAFQEGFIPYLKSIIREPSNEGCIEIQALANSEPFLQALQAGHYRKFYDNILRAGEPISDVRPINLADWLEIIGLAPNSKENEIDIQEALISCYCDEKKGCILREIAIDLSKNEIKKLLVARHIVPIILPYLVNIFYSKSGMEGKLTEGNLINLLRNYLLDEHGNIDDANFKILMDFSKRPYFRTRQPSDQLARLNYDLIFFLIGKDTELSGKLEKEHIGQILSLDDDKLNRPLNALKRGDVAQKINAPRLGGDDKTEQLFPEIEEIFGLFNDGFEKDFSIINEFIFAISRNFKANGGDLDKAKIWFNDLLAQSRQFFANPFFSQRIDALLALQEKLIESGTPVAKTVLEVLRDCFLGRIHEDDGNTIINRNDPAYFKSTLEELYVLAEKLDSLDTEETSHIEKVDEFIAHVLDRKQEKIEEQMGNESSLEHMHETATLLVNFCSISNQSGRLRERVQKIAGSVHEWMQQEIVDYSLSDDNDKGSTFDFKLKAKKLVLLAKVIDNLTSAEGVAQSQAISALKSEIERFIRNYHQVGYSWEEYQRKINTANH